VAVTCGASVVNIVRLSPRHLGKEIKSEVEMASGGQARLNHQKEKIDEARRGCLTSEYSRESRSEQLEK